MNLEHFLNVLYEIYCDIQVFFFFLERGFFFATTEFSFSRAFPFAERREKFKI